MVRCAPVRTPFLSNRTAATEIYTLSLHDALPILKRGGREEDREEGEGRADDVPARRALRSEEHTSELQSHHDLVCRLLLEKKKSIHSTPTPRARVSETTEWTTCYRPWPRATRCHP